MNFVYYIKIRGKLYIRGVLYFELNYGSIRLEIIYVRLCVLKDCYKVCLLVNMKILFLCNNYF